MRKQLASSGFLICMVAALVPVLAESGKTRPVKVKDLVIYQDEQYYAAFPSLVVKKDGEILCAFRRAPDRRRLWQAPGTTHTDPNSYLVLVRSRDQGNSWTAEPELIFAHPLGGSQDPCMNLLRNGTIVCSSYGWALLPAETAERKKNTLSHPPFAFLGGYLLRSADGGRSWQGPILPPPTPGDQTLDALDRPVPAYNRGAMMEGRDGKLYWAVAANRAPQDRRSSVHLMASADRGTTWNYVGPIAQDEKVVFNETSLVETVRGDILAFLRTDKFEGKLAFARSTDGGKSFQPWQDGGFFGHPFQAVRLKDGRIFLVYGYRRKPFGIRARLLDADGSDPARAEEIVLREDGGSGDLGYPWAALLKDGRILVAYYFNRENGTRHIAASLLELR